MLPTKRDTLKYVSVLFAAAFCTLTIALPTWAQFSAPKIAVVTASARPGIVPRGGRGILYVLLSVAPRFHINAHHPGNLAYIQTTFHGQSMPGISYGPAHYPTAQTVKVSYSSKPLLVYTGKVMIVVPYSVLKTAKTGAATLMGAVSYQGCDANSCYPPASTPTRAVVVIK